MNDAVETIAEAIAGTVSVDPGIVSAYLFGSVAAGREHRESDLDVGVLLDWGAYPTRPVRFDARLRLIAALVSALDRRDIDLLILNDAPPHFAREVVTRGRRVYVSDAELDHAFRRDSMLRAADLEPFLHRTRRLKLDALLR